ncbi:hypothetical protein [Actinacidiphila oryziradicis]|uniref:Uncharacterized protein n=1 Tax=Actinacidiphila oryziradicis TaxID=2571141 RepID=A0A4U0S4D6_9ACTN|nr:hypothetical protein [Actinacidiphila oryziradicis]TKA03173.1 hypothetical protein FCI23_37120 [Actinacidiphila oryziradicis]
MRHTRRASASCKATRPARDTASADTKRTGIGVAIDDFVWLAAYTWAKRPDLEVACLSGYGRAFAEAEMRALPAFTALAAVDDLQWAAGNDDAVEVARAQHTLARLVVTAHR